MDKHINYTIPRSYWTDVCNRIANVPTEAYITALKNHVLTVLQRDTSTFPTLVEWAKDAALMQPICWKAYESAIEDTAKNSVLWTGLGAQARNRVLSEPCFSSKMSSKLRTALSVVAGAVFDAVKNQPSIVVTDLPDGRFNLRPNGVVPDEVYAILEQDTMPMQYKNEFLPDGRFRLETKIRYALYPAARTVVEELAKMKKKSLNASRQYIEVSSICA